MLRICLYFSSIFYLNQRKVSGLIKLLKVGILILFFFVSYFKLCFVLGVCNILVELGNGFISC